LSVRAAAEKPPLSTTFTKVAMLVMRSMRSPNHAVGRAGLSRRFALSSCQRSRLLTFSTGANGASSRVGPPRSLAEFRLDAEERGLRQPLMLPRPALRRPERILRHAHGVRHRSVLGAVCKVRCATVDPHAFDDDGSVIIRLVDALASDDSGRDLMPD